MINTCPFFLVALLKSQTEDVRKDLKLSDIRFIGLCNEIFFFKDPLLPPFFNYPYYHSTHIVLCNFGIITFKLLICLLKLQKRTSEEEDILMCRPLRA